MRATLVVCSLKGNEVIYPLEPGMRLTIGRHRTNDLVVQDEHCSRRHAEVYEENGVWTLVDLDSQNGTFIDGERITKAALRHGQQIRMGGVRLRYVEQSELGPAATWPEPRAFREAVAAADTPDTDLQPDEVSALCKFMAEVIGDEEAPTIIHRALETVQSQTHADVAGFLGLDEGGDLLARHVLPSASQVDLEMSRSLTRTVQQEGRPLWLGRDERQASSDSLAAYRDAICVPVHGSEGLAGVIHLYSTRHSFSERDLMFCEAVGRHLSGCLRLVRLRRQLAADNSRLRAEFAVSDQIVGRSRVIQELRQVIARAAPQQTTVLIRGESGVGKELVAEALHKSSRRRSGPFVVVNCAALSPTLAESQLFGHRRGAFTGADRDQAGFFQQADEGTLFLDEIGELSSECQAKLLRVLETRRFTPLGGAAEQVVDVRFIAATNQDLSRRVAEGRFRHDLYFRLQVAEIVVPPLRERREDIEPIAQYFLKQLAQRGMVRKQLTPAALERLQAHDWPGNVRELRNVLESACIFSEGELLDAEHLQFHVAASAGGSLPTLNLEELERLAVHQAMHRAGGSPTAAAEMLGIARSSFYRKAAALGLKFDES